MDKIYGRSIPNVQEEESKEFLIDNKNELPNIDSGEGLVETVLSKKPKSLSSDVIYKDFPMFFPELLIQLGLFVFAVIGIVLLRIFSMIQTNGFKEMVSQQAFTEIGNAIMFQQTIFMIIIAIPILISFGLFVFKWWLFYPRGNKNIAIRAWKSGGARISIDDLCEGGLKFDNKEDSPIIPIPNPRKTWDLITSRPIILLEEGMPSNSSLHRAGGFAEKIKDKAAAQASIFNAAMRYARYQMGRRDSFFQNPTNILLLIVAGLVVLIGLYLIFMKPDSVTTVIDGVTSRSGGV